MQDQKSTSDSNANPFVNSKQSLVLKLKVVATQAFHYRNFSDLKTLIQFVGSRPVINEDASLQFKKVVVPDNSIVLRDEYGAVVRVMSYEEADKGFEIAAQSEWKAEHANKVKAKEIKAKK